MSSSGDGEFGDDGGAAVAGAVAQAATVLKADEWEDTISRCVPAIVAIKFATVTTFDTHKSGSSHATGFVVDTERGLILTNRHVVRPGPVVALAVFSNHEEVKIRAVYRDPVHDFGFYQFDVADLKFLALEAIQLCPEKPRVGIPIRVLGNDAGEKLSILQSTLARLDRKAPRYGVGKYNDFNTFYYQAASSTSGGSSGSPVLAVDGTAIALNAGGKTRAAASFYLPLDRPLRALRLIQAGEPIPRGTLQVILEHENYDECRRLGLREEIEADFRELFPDSTGLLAVTKIGVDGPGFGEGRLEEGDLLLAVNGVKVVSFLPLEEVLDTSVGGEVELTVERGGEEVVVSLPVQDLHSITPSEYVSFGGGVIHALSYQKAIQYNVAVGSVFVCSAGFSLSRRFPMQSGAVILAVGNVRTPDLDAFERVMSSFAQGQVVPIRWISLSDIHTEHIAVIPVERKLFEMKRAIRNDATGFWDFESSPPGPDEAAREPQETDFPAASHVGDIARSVVLISFDIPFQISGVHATRFLGMGLVVDAEKGLIVCDRNTVAIAFGLCEITFASSVKIPGSIVYLHPVHNFAIISYDPAMLGNSPVGAAVLSREGLEPSDPVRFVGSTAGGLLIESHARVTTVEAITIGQSKVPRFRETNLEVYSIDMPVGTAQAGGVLLDDTGAVRSLWFSFQQANKHPSIMRGLPTDVVADVVNPIRDGVEVELWSLEVEWAVTSMTTARDLGVPQDWVDRLTEKSRTRPQCLRVRRLVAGSPASDALSTGDLLLAIDGKAVTKFRDVEVLSQHCEVVDVTVWREGEEVTVAVETVLLNPVGIDRLVVFAGAVFHKSYRALCLSQKKVPDGVFISTTFSGSPASMYKLHSRTWVTKVNKQATPDLDTLVDVVSRIEDGATVRLKTVNMKRKVKVVTLRVDKHYWDAAEIVHTADDGWVRTPLGGRGD